MNVSLIAIDLAKNTFQVCGVNRQGKEVFNRPIINMTRPTAPLCEESPIPSIKYSRKTRSTRLTRRIATHPGAFQGL
jgi:hypothetical protein